MVEPKIKKARKLVENPKNSLKVGGEVRTLTLGTDKVESNYGTVIGYKGMQNPKFKHVIQDLFEQVLNVYDVDTGNAKQKTLDLLLFKDENEEIDFNNKKAMLYGTKILISGKYYFNKGQNSKNMIALLNRLITENQDIFTAPVQVVLGETVRK